MSKEKNIWNEIYNAKVQLEKERIITEFLLEIANPRNWGCSACGDDVYGCDGNPHCIDVWIKNDDEIPMYKAMEILFKLREK